MRKRTPRQKKLIPEAKPHLEKEKDLLNDLMKDKRKMEEIQRLISPSIPYDAIKFQSTYYSIGDKIIVFANNENLIAELVKIIPKNGIKDYPLWPSIQVRWYYKKADINRKKNHLDDETNFASISEYELFETDHKDIIFIETVIAKCSLYTYDDYEALEDHTDYTFFCRAQYDPNKGLLHPPFNTWAKGCLCMKPLNPDQLYIKCDKCNQWFHPSCCGIDDDKIEDVNSFFCVNCIKEESMEG